MTRIIRLAYTLSLPLLLAGCGERARPAEARETVPTADTTGTTGAVEQQTVQNAIPAAAAPGPGPGPGQ